MATGYSASASSSDALSASLRSAITTGNKTLNFGSAAGSTGITSTTLMVAIAVVGLVAIVYFKKKK